MKIRVEGSNEFEGLKKLISEIEEKLDCAVRKKDMKIIEGSIAETESIKEEDELLEQKMTAWIEALEVNELKSELKREALEVNELKSELRRLADELSVTRLSL